jgi:hypothetical protein
MLAERPVGVDLPEKSKVKVVAFVLSEPAPETYGEVLSGSVPRFMVVTVLLNLRESKLCVVDQLTVRLLNGRAMPTLLFKFQETRSLITVPSVSVRLLEVQL